MASSAAGTMHRTDASGEGSAEAYLRRCARAAGALAELGPRQGIEARVRSALDLPLGNVEDEIINCCGDDRFDGGVIRRAKCNLGHSSGPYTRDVTDRSCEPAAKQKIEVLGLENSGEPWLDVLSSTIDQGVQFIGVCRQIVPGA